MYLHMYNFFFDNIEYRIHVYVWCAITYSTVIYLSNALGRITLSPFIDGPHMHT